MQNRSMPAATVIPVLAYRDVREAVEWLCRAFGFRERLQIGEHRSQLTCGEGAIVVTTSAGDPAPSAHSILVRVDDVDAHCERARRAGATILGDPADFPYGERQYSVRDPGGHEWTFSQSIADSDPARWGGRLIE